MTIAEQIKTFKTPLEAWLAQRKGKLAVCADVLRAFSAILSQRPGAPCAYLLCNGEVPRGEIGGAAEVGRVDRTFLLVVSCGQTMKLELGEALVSEDGGTLDMVEEAREVLRATKFESDNPEEIFPDYKGIRPFQIDGYLLDAWQIEVSVGAQLPIHDQSFMKMKKLFTILCLLIAVNLPGADVVFDLSNFQTSPLATRKVLITPTGLTTNAGALVSADPKIFTTGSNAVFTVSNMVPQYYYCEIQKPPATTPFWIHVTNSLADTSTISASAITVPTTDVPSGLTYTKAQIDALIAAIEGGGGGGLDYNFDSGQFFVTGTTNVALNPTNWTGGDGILAASIAAQGAAVTNNFLTKTNANLSGMTVFHSAGEAPITNYYNFGEVSGQFIIKLVDSVALPFWESDLLQTRFLLEGRPGNGSALANIPISGVNGLGAQLTNSLTNIVVVATNTPVTNPGHISISGRQATYYQPTNAGSGVKIYRALMSQGDEGFTSGSFEVGEIYRVDVVEDGDDFSNVGYEYDNVEFVATATTPTVWSNGTTVYHIGQPTAIVLENTLGGEVVWTRAVGQRGEYLGTLAGGFPEFKTSNGSVIRPFNSSQVIRAMWRRDSDDAMWLKTANTESVDWEDDGLIQTFIEILVYP